MNNYLVSVKIWLNNKKITHLIERWLSSIITRKYFN